MSIQGLKELELDLKEMQERICPNDRNVFMRALTLNVLKDLIIGTPVKTGLARGNWQVTSMKPAEEPVSTLDPDGSATLAKGSSGISENNFNTGPLWISNNLPYIADLEDGNSKQAPNGWVENALLKVKRMAEKA